MSAEQQRVAANSIAQRRENGERTLEIAKEYGVHPTAIYRLLHRHGAYRHIPRLNGIAAKMLILEDRNRQVVDEYARGDTAPEIAARHNISRQRVYQIVSRARKADPEVAQATRGSHAKRRAARRSSTNAGT